MDFITCLPVTQRGYDGIFTIVDRFSKYCVLVPYTCTSSAVDVARMFFDHVVCTYGMPRRIVSDRDVRFMSTFWRSLMDLL